MGLSGRKHEMVTLEQLVRHLQVVPLACYPSESFLTTLTGRLKALPMNQIYFFLLPPQESL